MKQMKLSPSMMCADFFDLRSQVEAFEKTNVELLHIDVMDGNFVPNYALGTDFVRQLKKHTSIPLDIHLMIEQPERLLDSFPFGEGDYVSIHSESTRHLQRVLQAVKDRGAKALLAFNPATPVEFATDVLDDIAGFLVMTVNPGFAGQKMVPHSLAKIARARALLNENGRPDAEIEVDGNVSLKNAVLMKEAGANIFVAGTSGVFLGGDLIENVRRFRETVFST